MTEVWFYHLEQTTADQTVPVLLEKTLAAGHRAVVQVRSARRAEDLTRHLWTYRAESWLPHGMAADGRAAEQPVWLTHISENPNDAGFLFLLDGQDWSAETAGHGKTGFTRVLDLFDGTDPDAVEAARDRWRADKVAGCDLSYWKQSPDGIWSRMA